ncbi:hypothetical protein ABPG75_007504 [Micractinium tetrahymenae]
MARVTSRAHLAASKTRRRNRLLGGAVLVAVLLLVATMSPQKGQPRSSQTSSAAPAADSNQPAASAEPAAVQAAEQTQQQQQLQQQEQPAGDGGSADQYRTGVFYTIGGKDGKPLEKHELLHEPVPEDCYMEVGPCCAASQKYCFLSLFGPRLCWSLECILKGGLSQVRLLGPCCCSALEGSLQHVAE